MTGFRRRAAVSALTATVIREALRASVGVLRSPFPCLPARLTEHIGSAVTAARSLRVVIQLFDSIIPERLPNVNTNPYKYTEKSFDKARIPLTSNEAVVILYA